MTCGCSPPIKARRITCHAWQPHTGSAERTQAQALAQAAVAAGACAQTHRRHSRRQDAHIDATSSGIRAVRWVIAHFHCLCIFMLLVSGVHLPLLAAASAAASASASAPASEPRGSSATAGSAASTGASASSLPSSSTVAPLKPHVVLLSLPWRGHMMPLLNLGARLVARGFHVSMGVATEEARDFVAAQVGSSIDMFNAGNFKACARVKRIRETQPLFEGTSDDFDAALQATLHPGAQLTDLYAAPYFAFQATDSSNSSASSEEVSAAAPNGVIALMRTYAAFQACMGSSVTAALADLTHPDWSETRWTDEKEKQRKEKQKFKEKEREKEKLIVAASTGSAALKKKEKDARELARNEREQALFPPVLQISAPKLIVVDRFTFAGLDAAKRFNISYVVNNPVSCIHTQNRSLF